MAPGRVALQVQVIERGVQVFQGLAAQFAVFERLAQFDGAGQALAGFAMQTQQALAAKQHVAVEEGLGQFVVGVVRRAGALVNVLGEEVQLQVAIDLGAGAAIADPMQNDLLGGVECRHHPAVLLRQGQASLLDIELAQRLEQRRLELEVLAQLAKQAGQAVLDRLMGEQSLPDHRQHAIPGRAGHQQQGFQPQAGDAAALLHADHAVYRENQCAGAEGGEALAKGAQHGQAECRQGQGSDEQPGVREQPLDGIRRRAETDQRHQHRAQAPLPAVIGLGQGAGDDAEKQRDQRMRPALPATQCQCAGKGDEHPQAGAELVQRPEAAQ